MLVVVRSVLDTGNQMEAHILEIREGMEKLNETVTGDCEGFDTIGFSNVFFRLFISSFDFAL